MSSLCLNMIVKNEAHVVRELLESVLPFIQSWVIVDTGSTDGTQELIRAFFRDKGLSGELHERPWRDFGHNRSEALALAQGKADYTWVIDADDKLFGQPQLKHLTKDSYDLKFGSDFTYWRKQIFKSQLDWRYIGVLHEYPHSDQATTSGRIEGHYYIDSRRLGARSLDPEKYRKDAEILERALEGEPLNSRYWFYLGQSWFDAQEYQRSREAYAKRAEMQGWVEEVFYSLYRVGVCDIKLGADEKQVVADLLAAYNYRPTRAESLHELARYFREQGKFALGYHFAKAATQIPMPPEDILFVYADVYYYRALDELGACAYYTPFWRDGLAACQQLLKRKIPPADLERVKSNIACYQNQYLRRRG